MALADVPIADSFNAGRFMSECCGLLLDVT